MDCASLVTAASLYSPLPVAMVGIPHFSTESLPANPQPADRMKAALLEMARFSDRIPLLPDSAYSRESIYADHD